MYDEQEDTNPPVRSEVKVFWLIIAVFIAIAVINAFLRGMDDRWTYIQTVVLSITLIVVAWNAYLTRNMQQAMETQIRVNILPIIKVRHVTAGDLIEIEGGQIKSPFSSLELENIGQAAALNIELDDMYIRGHITSSYVHKKGNPFWFNKLLTLSPKEKVRVGGQDIFAKAGSESISDELQYLNPKKAQYDYDVNIRFSDVLGNRYVQTYKIGKNGISAGIVQESKNVPKLTIGNSI